MKRERLISHFSTGRERQLGRHGTSVIMRDQETRITQHFSGLYAIFLLCLLLPPQVSAAEFSASVVSVIDGDTIDVLHNGQAERIRLNGIDCPERGQAFGKKAKQFTSSLVYGKEVNVQTLRMDRHGRTVGDVLLPDGTNVSRELPEGGAGVVVLAILERCRSRSLGARGAGGQARGLIRTLSRPGKSGIRKRNCRPSCPPTCLPRTLPPREWIPPQVR
jgi:endonuclease YncB( thermonuclease family)